VRAIEGLDLSVPRGSVCAFLGRNGAGKTTTIKILLGMDRADAGSGCILGYPIGSACGSLEIRRRTGFVSETKDLYPFMTVAQILRYTRPFFPNWRMDLEQRYLRLFGLPLNRAIPDLSKGMQTQLMLLLALARAPELLILDEPTEGLDPIMVDSVLQSLVEAAGSGTSVFFSTHQLAEVERIADRILILHNGRVVVEGELDEIRRRYKRIEFTVDRGPADMPAAFGDEIRVHHEGRLITIYTDSDPADIIDTAKSAGLGTYEVHPASLKELFLEYAG
jgi:ABC-2 type transport system ATP-binding protein